MLLRDNLFAGHVDGETIAEHLNETETHLASVSHMIRAGAGRETFDRFLDCIERSPERIAQAMRDMPEHAATLFALLPAQEMFAVFGEVEQVDPELLGDVVDRAPGVLKVVAAQRFGFLGAMSKLAELLKLCRRPVFGPQF